MIGRLASWLDRINRTAIIGGLVIAFVVLTALFPMLYAQMDSDARLVDGQFGSTPKETYTLLEALGEPARRLYAWGEGTLDLAYPLVYSALLALLLTRTLPRVFPQSDMLHRLRLLPFGAGLFDLAENTSIILLIRAFPRQLPGLARLLSAFNQTKWILLGLSLALLLLAGLLARLRGLRKAA